MNVGRITFAPREPTPREIAIEALLEIIACGGYDSRIEAARILLDYLKKGSK